MGSPQGIFYFCFFTFLLLEISQVQRKETIFTMSSNGKFILQTLFSNSLLGDMFYSGTLTIVYYYYIGQIFYLDFEKKFKSNLCYTIIIMRKYKLYIICV